MPIIRYLVIIISTFAIYQATLVQKCHYEGDFTVYCNQARVSNGQTELIHRARVTYGLQYNDTYCAYTSKTCSKTFLRDDCVDKVSCEVINGWLSMEPYCDGNSYYTQFEYSCQPAYYMCDNQHHENVFSGLVLSPSYPVAYSSESNKKCIQTLVFPLGHYVEISVENFTMPRTENCARDFLEILEFRDLVWKSLTVLCGNYSHGLRFIAKSNVISFKLRTLVARSTALINFKLFVQAIPPNLSINNSSLIFDEPFETPVLEAHTTKTTNDHVILAVACIGGFLIIVVFITISILVMIKCRKSKHYKRSTRKIPAKVPHTIELERTDSLSSSLSPPISKSTITKPSNSISIKDADHPRKMIAERPALLQDLSQSKLLNKYKLSLHTYPDSKSNEQVNKKLIEEKVEIVEETGQDVQENKIEDQKSIEDELGVYSAYVAPATIQALERRIAFNPLHVILKDKLKYYPTEYV